MILRLFPGGFFFILDCFLKENDRPTLELAMNSSVLYQKNHQCSKICCKVYELSYILSPFSVPRDAKSPNQYSLNSNTVYHNSRWYLGCSPGGLTPLVATQSATTRVTLPWLTIPVTHPWAPMENQLASITLSYLILTKVCKY